MKILRLEEHIHYAEDYGVFDDVDSFLRGLKAEQWFYGK
jgi:hypothetical protein